MCMTATKETGYYWKYTMYDSNKRNWVLLTANCVWQQQKKMGITDSTLRMRATKKMGITDSKLCMTATKENGYYWEHTVYDSNKRKWILLTAHCVWQQQKKMDITDSTMCMRATEENWYYW